MTEELKKHGIIPDVEDDFKVELNLQVRYNGKEIDGSELTPSATSAEPEVKIDGPISANAIYTLIFVDPDAPSKAEPKFRNWRHWIVANIPGDDISKGTVLTPYIGPGPPPGTGLHRYTFWFYRQKGTIDNVNLNNEKDGRRSFDLRAFAKEHNLVGPLSASFFVSQHQQ